MIITEDKVLKALEALAEDQLMLLVQIRKVVRSDLKHLRSFYSAGTEKMCL